MKFQKLEPLEKHFTESFPNHLSPVYLILCLSDDERKKILSTLANPLRGSCDFFSSDSVAAVVAHMQNASLFHEKVAAVFDGVEKLTKADLEVLSEYLMSPNHRGVLLLGAGGVKNTADLYKVGKKELVVLDLSKEKPWEEADRMKKWLVQWVFSQKKKIAPDAVEALFARFPPNRLLLEQELEKLFCYLGDQDTVTLEAVEKLCSFTGEINPFKIAEELAWGNSHVPKVTDVGVLLPLITSLRNYLETGLQISYFLQNRVPEHEIATKFPRLRAKAFQRAIKGSKERGERYFSMALRALYDLELGVKTSLQKPHILFAHFCAKLRSL